MNLSRALWLALPMALLLPVACADNAPADPSADTVAAEVPVNASPAARGREHRRGHHRMALAQRMIHAAEKLDLGAAQRATLDTLKASLRGNGARGEHRALHEALVAGVRAGSIDAARIAPLHAAIEQAEAARRAKEADALNGLWKALEPAQRKALVATMRAKQAEHAEHAAEHEAAGKPGRLEHLTRQLDLDAAQQHTVEGLLSQKAEPAAPRWEAKRKHTEAVLAAFEGDGFDAAKIPAPQADGRDAMQRHVDFLSRLVPVLRPEQREKLAASMEKHAEHGEAPAAL